MISGISRAKLARQRALNYIPFNEDLSRPDWKPMPGIGRGVREIRVHVLGEWLMIYVAKFEDAGMCFIRFRRRAKKQINRILN